MNKREKFIDSLVFEYLNRMEKNSSLLFSANRGPVCMILYAKLYIYVLIFVHKLENH